MARTTLALGALLVASTAHAGSMDPATDRLVLQPNGLGPNQTCQTIAGNPTSAPDGNPNDYLCQPANIAFANLVTELGFAMSPNAFRPANTTGIGGFILSIEASYTKINSDATSSDGVQYWHQGTRGPTDASTKSFTGVNGSPDGILSIYALKARKGLPLGFEVTGVLGYLVDSSLWMLGADVRWSVFEGFRHGAGGVLPDLSFGGGVRTVEGTSEFSLTTATIDVSMGKPIHLFSTVTLTPWVGVQRLWIFGDSSVIDSTPNADAFALCGYRGPDPKTGQPLCANTLPSGQPNNSDFNNNYIFQKVRTDRNRMNIGLDFKYRALHLAGQFLFDLTDPTTDAQDFLTNTRQWTISLEAGVYL